VARLYSPLLPRLRVVRLPSFSRPAKVEIFQFQASWNALDVHVPMKAKGLLLEAF